MSPGAGLFRFLGGLGGFGGLVWISRFGTISCRVHEILNCFVNWLGIPRSEHEFPEQPSATMPDQPPRSVQGICFDNPPLASSPIMQTAYWLESFVRTICWFQYGPMFPILRNQRLHRKLPRHSLPQRLRARMMAGSPPQQWPVVMVVFALMTWANPKAKFYGNMKLLSGLGVQTFPRKCCLVTSKQLPPIPFTNGGWISSNPLENVIPLMHSSSLTCG